MCFCALLKQNWNKLVDVWNKRAVASWVVVTIIKTSSQVSSKKRFVFQYLALTLLPFTMLCNKSQLSTIPTTTKNRFGPFDYSSIYTEQGYASWYGGNGDGFAGNMTANCEVYDPLSLTCAHKTLPFNTLIRVENTANGKNTVLRVNDRGPFINGRILDMSKRGAQELGLMSIGVANIRLQTVDIKGHPTAINLATSKGNPYTIQVAAFADPLNAKLLSKELEKHFNQTIYKVKQTSNGILVEKVRVGIYPNLEQAEKVHNRLAKFCKERKLEPFITRQY